MAQDTAPEMAQQTPPGMAQETAPELAQETAQDAGVVTGPHAGVAAYADELRRLAEASATRLAEVGSADVAAELLRAATQAADIATVIEHIPSGVMVADAAGRVLCVNEAWRRMWGELPDPARPVPEQVGSAYRLRDPHTGRALSAQETPLARALAGETVHAEFLSRRDDQAEDHWCCVSAAPRRDAEGNVVGAVALFSDVTRERQLQRELGESAERLRTVYTAAACGLMIINAAGEIMDANEAAREILGLSPEHVPGVRLSDWLLSTPDGRELSLAERPGPTALVTGQTQRAVLAQLTRPDGTHRWLQIDAAPVPAADDRIEQAVVSFVDVTERKRAEAALEYQASHDMVTALPNRALFHKRLRQALNAALCTRQPLALLLADLDRFKEVNDTLGHHVGDLLLQEVGARLEDTLRASDTVARLGGDEFAVLLPGADEAGAAATAGKLLAALNEPLTVEGQDLDVGASIGIALYPDHSSDDQTLLRQADVAMYLAKRTQSGYAVYTPDQDQHSPARLALVSALRSAIERGQLVLHFQPKVSIATGQIHGVEALVRWYHPEQGLIPPDQFITVAEHSGLIAPLTRWVLEAALQQCQAWQRVGFHVGVAVNLSVRTLQDSGLPDTVAEALQRYEVAPERLTLEITESALMADPARARDILVRLSSLGVRIAIDDFGTGYSSLGYLKRLPVDELKIDKSFVLRLGATTSLADSAIVRSVIAMAQALALEVVAEGVESRAAWELLRALGCDAGQGYYMSEPLPAGDLERWARTSPWGQRASA